MHRVGLLLPLVAALACGRTASHRALESLPAPSDEEPMVACVDAVLTNSPLFERALTKRRVDRPRARGLMLRNPPGAHPTGLGVAITPARGAPREIVVDYAWPGPWQGTGGGMKPPADPKVSDVEGAMLADISAGLLSELRAECAPSAPGEPVCSRVAQGRTGRCVLGT